jgi:glycosyltransferase involved in cell wall biosynthesis
LSHLNIPHEILQAATVIANADKYDIIHNNYWHYYELTSLSKFTSRPIVTTMHNHVWHYPELREILYATHQKGKDVVVFASHAVERLAQGRVDSEVIYHGIDTHTFAYSATPSEYFLWFSRLVPNKGIAHAIEAAQKEKFSLVVAGSYPVKRENQLYISEHIQPKFVDNISYVGTPDETQRVLLYQNAKALIFPTLLEEQFGLVMAEALSCGTPVIAYNRGAVSEVIEDGVTGFIIDPDEVDRPGKGSWSIKATGVEGIIEATRRINEISRAACRQRAQQLFSKELMIAQYIALYQRLATGR